jgi:hypothetical protein
VDSGWAGHLVGQRDAEPAEMRLDLRLPASCLYAGPVALAFAASCAVRRPGDYAGLLEPLDRGIAAWVPARLASERKRIQAAGREPPSRRTTPSPG